MPSYLTKKINWLDLEIDARDLSCLFSDGQQKTTLHAESPLQEVEEINQEIHRIDQEISQLWAKFPKSDTAADEFMHDSLIAFFLQKKVYLKNLQLKADEIVNEKPITVATYREELNNIVSGPTHKVKLQEPPKKRKSRLHVVFDIGKKIIDLLDDAWDAARSELSPNDSSPIMTGILSGGVSFIIFMGEGVIAAKEFKDVYYSSTGQRKIKLLTSAMSFLIAGVGAGLALALFASTVGASVAGAPFFVVLLPALLGAIYSMALWKKSYVFYQAKMAFDEAKKKYDECLQQCEKFELLCKNEKDPDKKSDLEKKLNYLNSELAFLEQSKEIANEKKFYAKKQVAFTAIEITCVAFTLVGTILSVAATIGLGAATFGALPLALIVIGVVSGMVLKYFEHKDENTRYQYTDSLWPWLREQGNKIKNVFSFSHNKKKNPSYTDEVTKEKSVNVSKKSKYSHIQLPTPLELGPLLDPKQSVSHHPRRSFLSVQAPDNKARASFSFFKSCQPGRKGKETKTYSPSARTPSL